MEGHAVHVVPTGSRWDGKVEMLIATVLGLAAITGAFAAYKREGREHDAERSFTAANITLTKAVSNSLEGQQELTFDHLLFMNWYLTPTGSANEEFIHDRMMDPTLRKATDWWNGDNRSYAETGSTPFDPRNKYWRPLPQAREAAGQRAESQRAFLEARTEQDTADSYTRVEVVLATALFLLGVAGVTRNAHVRFTGTGLGTAIFLIAVGMLVGI